MDYMCRADTENYCLRFFQDFWKRCTGEVINCLLENMSMNIRFAAKTNQIAHNVRDKTHWTYFSVFFFPKYSHDLNVFKQVTP